MTFQVEMDKLIKEKRLYFLGDSLPPDWYAAFKIWLPMAEAADPKAQFNIGRCYDQGEGVDEDKNKAKEWYLKAAEQDDPRAFFNLYLFYSNEKSEEKNLEKAEYFFKRAADAGEVRAIQAIRNKKAKQEEQLFIQINKNADAKLSEFLKNSENEKAISFINEISDPRLIWMKDYLPLLSCEYFEHGDGSFILKNNSSESCFFRWPDMVVPAYTEKRIQL
jgi:TPR repeat protein